MQLPLATIVHDEPGIANQLLSDFAARTRAQGWRVRGLVQNPEPAERSVCYHHMELIDIELGERYLISQNLGSGSSACCLNPAGVSAASVVLRRALQDHAELAIANRFGTLESEGGGMADELLALMLAGIPLLTAVKLPYLDAWRQFTGGMAVELPADDAALQAWWDACRTAPEAAA